MSLTDAVYHRAPVPLQNVLVSAMGAHLYTQRYGRGSHAQLRLLRTTMHRSRDELVRDQMRAMDELLAFSVEHVPFYRRIGRVPPIRSVDDWVAVRDDIPIVGKADLREDPERFVAPREAAPGRRFTLSTSGTSGTPLTIVSSYEARRRHYAFWQRLRGWYGVGPRDLRATFFGRIIMHADEDQPPFWRYDWPQRNMLFSSYHLDERHLHAYYERLRALQPAEVIGYASSLAILAAFINRNQLAPLAPRVVFSTAETLLAAQREEIEAAFAAPLVNQYGSTEMVVFAAECRHGTMHVHPEHGFLEVVDAKGRAVGDDEPGEAVCTGFLNRAMPLVRYRLGDRVTMTERPCDCGSAFPVISSIEGRVDDVLITPSGRPIPRLDPIFKGMRGIRETQIVQVAKDAVVLRLCADPSFGDEDERALIAEAAKRMGPEMHVSVERVDAIPKEANGKFRSVVRLPFDQARERPASGTV